MKETATLDKSSKILSSDDFHDMYHDPLDHLQDEFSLLGLKILRQLNIVESRSSKGTNSNGFFISEEEVRSFLNISVKVKNYNSGNESVDILKQKIDRVESSLLNKVSNIKEHTNYPLQLITDKFGLNRFETQVLIMALALEIDKKYERIFAYFNDDLNKRSPSIDLALNTFCENDEELISAHRYFSKHAPLRSYRLINLVKNQDEGSFLSKRFKVDEGIKNLILGIDIIHPRLKCLVKTEYPQEFEDISSSKVQVKNQIRKVLDNSFENEFKGMTFWLYGKSCEEKKSIVKALCGELGIPLIVIDLENILSDHEPETMLRLLLRDAVINSAAILFRGGDLLLLDSEKERSFQGNFIKLLAEFSWFFFIDAKKYWANEEYSGSLQWCPIEVESPQFSERRDLWASLLKKRNIADLDIDNIASRFAFDENQIAKAVGYINLYNSGSQVSFDSLLKACSFQSPKTLPAFTKRITPKYKWDDLVLPEDKLQHLKEICGFLKNKHQVYFNWGFDKKLSLGRGLNILFTGPSGTGKTMTAEIMADELKLDLYKIDLSSIVSKYIGETEKNLEKIFDATSSGNAILFFDEADALFGKRSEVKDSHDRFANMETNYLLQKIEEHEGVVVLSTNFSKNMDDAFLRRIQFTVEFPFPDEQYREVIWRKIYPPAAPLSKSINYKFFSEKLKISGGNIKNIALASAFLAAEDNSTIEMRHIMHAVKREYQKLGKPFVKEDFGKYFEEDGV